VIDMPEKENEKNENIKSAREHMKAAHEAIHNSINDFLPKGYVEHKQTARKEMLLAVRSLIDAAIDHAEKKHKKP
jgi:hypothetical protein